MILNPYLNHGIQFTFYSNLRNARNIHFYIYIYLASKYDIDVTTVLLMLLIYKSLQSYNSVRDTLFSVVDVLYKLTNASAF